jgi:hypothetical protein
MRAYDRGSSGALQRMDGVVGQVDYVVVVFRPPKLLVAVGGAIRLAHAF